MTVDIVEMLKEPRMIKVAAPMVRYSRLPFRNLVKKYNCDVCFTPMIMADSFVQSEQARQIEFATNSIDNPLVVQFAANKVDDFVDATEMVSSYCDGVDLNCGCPQKWAMKDGYGADLLTKPQLVKDLVSQVRNRTRAPFTVSVKIRLLKEIRRTIEFVRCLEHAGVSFLTVHARTPQMRHEPIDMDGLKLVRDSTQLPLIANGDVRSLEGAELLYRETKCDGVMAARGLLANPAMYSGEVVTPVACISDWLDFTRTIPTSFNCFHHHLVFMLEKVLPKDKRLVFNALQSEQAIHEFLQEEYGIVPQTLSDVTPVHCDFNSGRNGIGQRVKNDCSELDEDALGNIFFDE